MLFSITLQMYFPLWIAVAHPLFRTDFPHFSLVRVDLPVFVALVKRKIFAALVRYIASHILNLCACMGVFESALLLKSALISFPGCK
jgi:hypothetical protein